MLFNKIICLAFLTLSWNLAHAQTVDQKNLTWYSSQCTENHSGMQMNSDVKIAVLASTSVTLVIQEQTLSFSIASISGSWFNENTDGTLKYNLLYDGSQEGSMTITKQAGATSISIDFTEKNPDGIDYDFLINRVEAN